MRVLVFHGYLLGGTGSNVYNARLAAALARQGHAVHLLCQEREPDDLDFVSAAGDWDGGALAIRQLRPAADGAVTVYRPDIGSILPVYVADRYDGITARLFSELSDTQVADYVARNVAAVAEVAALVKPDVALANHLVMGPLVLARALGGGVPYAVKIHGSALEYTVKPEPERFLGAAREGVARAAAVLVGSGHTARSLWAVIPDQALRAKTRLCPPGVDVESFRPYPRAERGVALGDLRRRLGARGEHEADGDSAFARDLGAAADAVGRLRPEEDKLVAFVGKLIAAKGADLLVAAWPLVLERVPAARLVVVGFGSYREALERLIAALAGGDLEEVRRIAAQGRAGEGGPAAPLTMLTSFLDDLQRRGPASYLTAAERLPEQIVMCGRLEHDELAPLLGACEALVVPSTFPEAFGMVAVEAAACGVPPICADHSGLAEVAPALAGGLPAPTQEWLSYPLGPGAVDAIADRVTAWLSASPQLRAQAQAALVATARRRFSWEGVACGVLAAAAGRIGELPAVQ